MIGHYAEDIATAREMIAEDGEVVSWDVVTLAPVDEDKPWLGSTETPVNKRPSIVFVPAGGATFSFLQFMKGTEVPQGSVMGLMGAVDFTPKIGDEVIRSSGPLTLKTIDKIQPAEEVILYVLGFVG